MADLPDILAALEDGPDHGSRWLALSSWLWERGREDEAAAVRIFWPSLWEVVAGGTSLRQALRTVARNAPRLGRKARAIEAWANEEREVAEAGESGSRLCGVGVRSGPGGRANERSETASKRCSQSGGQVRAGHA